MCSFINHVLDGGLRDDYYIRGGETRTSLHRVPDVVPFTNHHILEGGLRDDHHIRGGEPQAGLQELVGVTRAGLAPFVLYVLEKQPGVLGPAFKKILIQKSKPGIALSTAPSQRCL